MPKTRVDFRFGGLIWINFDEFWGLMRVRCTVLHIRDTSDWKQCVTDTYGQAYHKTSLTYVCQKRQDITSNIC